MNSPPSEKELLVWFWVNIFGAAFFAFWATGHSHWWLVLAFFILLSAFGKHLRLKTLEETGDEGR